jgi:DNA primase
MVDQLLVTLVDSVLGSGRDTARSNRAYHCPFCDHHKPKLEVCMNTNSKGENPWNCWVCGKKGKKLINLFKSLKVDSLKIKEIKSLVGDSKSTLTLTQTETLSLPKEFVSFYPIPDGIIAKHALAYLKSRNITEEDIIKYNIGYCEYGEHANMIIIPSYDENGTLNYFSARSFDKNSSRKYKNPQISRDIIPFEFYINWNSPLILCEGVFDALAIKRNVIPLLGKNISKELMKKIVMSSIQKIYIALDKDAIKEALGFCENLLNQGKKVYLVELQDKDPGEMGFANFTNLIQQTPKLTFSKLFEKKLQLV